MKQRHNLSLPLLAAGLLAISACGSDGSNQPDRPEPNPPPTSSVSFGEFVRDLFANTSDTADPVEIDATEFTFDDADDPDAFDDLLD